MTSVPNPPRSVKPHYEAVEDLLSILGRQGAWGHYWSLPSRKTVWFPIGERPEPPQDGDVYFGVHPCSEIPPTNSRGEEKPPAEVRSQIRYIAAVNGVFSEFDAKVYGSKEAILAHLDTLPLYPTCTVDSGGGFHCYWLIEDGPLVTDANRDHLRRLQAAWVTFTGGDNGAKDLARVLRLPGTRNHKYPDKPMVTVVDYHPYRLYHLADIEGFVSGSVAQKAATEQSRREIDASRTDEVASGAAEQLLNWCIHNAKKGSRHNMALWLAGRLKAEGLARWVAERTLLEFARQVNAPDGRQIDDQEMVRVANYIWGQS